MLEREMLYYKRLFYDDFCNNSVSAIRANHKDVQINYSRKF